MQERPPLSPPPCALLPSLSRAAAGGGAGLASSASGYACLVFALAQLAGVALGPALSAVARQGSGSACRSLYGGFVRWEMGRRADGADCVSSQVAPAAHWPQIEVGVTPTGSVSGALPASCRPASCCPWPRPMTTLLLCTLAGPGCDPSRPSRPSLRTSQSAAQRTPFRRSLRPLRFDTALDAPLRHGPRRRLGRR